MNPYRSLVTSEEQFNCAEIQTKEQKKKNIQSKTEKGAGGSSQQRDDGNDENERDSDDTTDHDSEDDDDEETPLQRITSVFWPTFEIERYLYLTDI